MNTGDWGFPRSRYGLKNLEPFDNYVVYEQEWLCREDEVAKLIKLAEAGKARQLPDIRHYNINRVWFPHKHFPKLYRRTQKFIERANAEHWNQTITGWEHELRLNIYPPSTDLWTHHDHSEVDQTKITLMQQMTSDFIGGVLMVATERFQVPLNPGDVVVMPGWMTHGRMPITSGRLVTFNAWATGPRFH